MESWFCSGRVGKIFFFMKIRQNKKPCLYRFKQSKNGKTRLFTKRRKNMLTWASNVFTRNILSAKCFKAGFLTFLWFQISNSRFQISHLSEIWNLEFEIHRVYSGATARDFHPLPLLPASWKSGTSNIFSWKRTLFSRVFRKTRVRQSITLLRVFVKAFQI